MKRPAPIEAAPFKEFWREAGAAYAPVTRQITLPTSSATTKEPAWTDALPEADRDFMQSIARRR
ncbi:hypothetical protein [Bradyrhizobium erythrophlei]|uniref:Uncharacterized protein n=1 Tax=Bradyrhizobium erythrophlei TaxID=1437360 RepID=A0A1H5E7A7_9BRAD|nr:hypothetical protein [Bradyrhizobium erythrophlei]SED87042.1 hypothetical protein SAMN05444164_6102 [Bradyrhizobium erythrophlei]